MSDCTNTILIRFHSDTCSVVHNVSAQTSHWCGVQSETCSYTMQRCSFVRYTCPFGHMAHIIYFDCARVLCDTCDTFENAIVPVSI